MSSVRSVAVRADKKGKLMWEALREALDEEMEQDPTVVLIGMLHLCLGRLCAFLIVFAAQQIVLCAGGSALAACNP